MLRAVAGLLMLQLLAGRNGVDATSVLQRNFCPQIRACILIVVSLPVCERTYKPTLRIAQLVQHLVSWKTNFLLPSVAAAIFATSPGRFPGTSSRVRALFPGLQLEEREADVKQPSGMQVRNCGTSLLPPLTCARLGVEQ
jgi:hypothetical protein